ncbi:cation diffusion facilitator family transporter [Polaribacter sargassicola]|uniref:cation diffusion facilitator family transporter n=1 Tax=Polaribacter sargassicola TaxID=2836891 RepID=UPI001F1FB1FB|nr:cation diffusion facilitator family transporter [Polaribacter sp. DS7-9]MCG1036829.1 cation diffusion facilitator family transporter [Polaribacter sp. DS7-9]
MGHHHHHSGHQHTSTENISTAFFLNLFFSIVEFIGGIYTNSLAITSDAIHDLGDSISLGLAWYFQKISNKKPTKIFTYGFKRYSLLGAIINSLILLIGSILIIIKAIPRIINPEASNTKGMMWIAILGIIVNGAAVLKLRKGTSINERVVSLHMLEDVLGWVAVLTASIVMQFYNVPFLDPLLSLMIAGFILFNVFKNGKESIRIILQATPIEVSVDKIKERIVVFDEIISVEDCHLWTMDGEYHILTIHLMLKDAVNWQKTNDLKNTLKTLLHDDFNIEHVTIELEVVKEDSDYIKGV